LNQLQEKHICGVHEKRIASEIEQHWQSERLKAREPPAFAQTVPLCHSAAATSASGSAKPPRTPATSGLVSTGEVADLETKKRKVEDA
jgi:hypothetical protein